MHSDKRRWRRVLPTVVGVSAMVTVTVIAMPWSHAETGEDGEWEVVHGDPDLGGQYRALAVADGQAWAFGNTDAQSATETRIDHFDGERWTAVEAPRGAEVTPQVADAADADNVWAAGESLDGTELLHFNGEEWSASQLDGTVSDIETIAADDAWVVGIAETAQRFDGSSWNEAPTPNGGLALDSLSGDEIYAAGAQDGQPSVEQWDGQEWTSMDVPEVDLDGCESAAFKDVLAKASDDLWAAGSLTCVDEDEKHYDKPLLALWDGSEWDITIGEEDWPYNQIADDGDNGLWLATNREYVHHAADGELTVHEIPGDDVQTPTVGNLGATNMIGTASLYEGGDPDEPQDYGIALVYNA